MSSWPPSATGVFDLGHEAQPGRFEGGPVGAEGGPAAGLHLVEAAELGAGEGGQQVGQVGFDAGRDQVVVDATAGLVAGVGIGAHAVKPM